MSVILSKVDITKLPAHDAVVYFIKIDWSKQGDISIWLRCRIHPDEKVLLAALGIMTLMVDLHFEQVGSNLSITSPVDYSRREVIIDWEFVEPYYHTIICSGGSVFKISCDYVRLEEVHESS